ncbi:MAG: shikimate dehydrogenase [Armatimonadetes bacterium]|nr:shikimate dehydrogenase [Armatimonadota bacterium]
MERFGFIIHPLNAKEDVSRKYPIARYLPTRLVEFGLKHHKPVLVSHITGVKSAAGAEAEGWFVGCPLTPDQQLRYDKEYVYRHIAAAGQLAADQGAKIVGLGAFTSVVGDGGISVAKMLPIAVTTGNSYTVATAIMGTLAAAEEVGIHPERATLAVIGATGSIGRTCALVLGEHVSDMILVGRDKERLAGVKREAEDRKISARIADNIESALKEADLVVTVTSAVDAVVKAEWIKPGAVVCDVARPRDVGQEVLRKRPDVLVIEGGVVKVPGDVDFGFTFGFEPGTAYACMSETMMLALEGRYENFTLGKEVSVEQVNEITALAEKHGFHLAGFRSFERPLTREQIDSVRRAAGRKARPTLTGGDLQPESG